MYGLGYNSWRLAARLRSAQFTCLSKYSHGELTNGHTRVTTTTLLQNTYDFENRQRRYVSLSKPSKDSSKLLNLNLKEIMSQSKDILKTVKLSDLSAAPQPAFWYGMGGLVPFVFPIISNILFGYSHFLATAQLLYGATICSFLGGVKWGNTLGEKSSGSEEPTWENLGLAVMPQLVAWTGLLLPQSLGFLAVSAGLIASAYIDLTLGCYPAWFKALRLCLTAPAVLFLLISCFIGLFH